MPSTETNPSKEIDTLLKNFLSLQGGSKPEKSGLLATAKRELDNAPMTTDRYGTLIGPNIKINKKMISTDKKKGFFISFDDIKKSSSEDFKNIDEYVEELMKKGLDKNSIKLAVNFETGQVSNLGNETTQQSLKSALRHLFEGNLDASDVSEHIATRGIGYKPTLLIPLL